MKFIIIIVAFFFREGDAITYHRFLTCGPLIQNELEFGVLGFEERGRPEYTGERGKTHHYANPAPRERTARVILTWSPIQKLTLPNRA